MNTHLNRLVRWMSLVGLLALLLCGLPGVAYGATLLNDNFEDGNAAGWTTNGGSWSVVSDGSQVYRQSSTSSNALAFASGTTAADQVVEARVKPIAFNGGSEYVAIVARAQNSSNYYYLALRNANKVELNKVVSGSRRVLVSVSLPPWPKTRPTAA